MVERLNATVKFREPFRPFAPVVLADRAAEYFELTQPSPFMSIAVPATDLAREKLGAIVHGNGTGRVQTVTADSNPFLTRVLEAFGKLTGHPVLINTSLNVKGKPICGTSADGPGLPDRIRPGRAAHRGDLGEQMRIGYSFWGFLGPGITDTPDGGRSHRATLIDALIARGHEVVFLQPDRDLTEAATT